ncbi:MAG: alkaline phosphatase [bacterium]
MKLISLIVISLLLHIACAANTIIIMVPGMGQGVISAAQAYQFGNEGKSFGGSKVLKMEMLPGQANLLKDAADDTLSVASTIATGVKPRAGRCGVDMQGITYQNLCEIAAAKKMKCGVISSSSFNSPIAESMYYHSSSLEDTSKNQFLSSKIDLFFAANYDAPADFAGKVIKKREEYNNLTLPIRGILPKYGLTLRGIDGTRADIAEPTLPEMADAAMNALANKSGFLLVIDAEGVEKSVSTKDAGLWVGELLGVDKTIDTIDKWITVHGGWTENNLLILGLNEKGVTSIQAGPAGTVPKVKFYSTDNINTMPPVYFRGKLFNGLKANFLDDRTYKKEMKIITPQKLFFTIVENM